MSSDLALVAVVAVVMVVGVAGTLLPVVPGLWLIWAAGVVYAVVAVDGATMWALIVSMTVLAIAGTAAGYLLPQRQASSVGVPWWGQILSAGAAVVGMFVIPVVGAAVGFVVGVFVVMVARTRRLGEAVTATWATIKAMALASGAQFVVGLLMLTLWVAFVVVA
ncbi:MAG: DUF456 domain-containing protein [Acidimicrobiia bacterium]